MMQWCKCLIQPSMMSFLFICHQKWNFLKRRHRQSFDHFLNSAISKQLREATSWQSSLVHSTNDKYSRAWEWQCTVNANCSGFTHVRCQAQHQTQRKQFIELALLPDRPSAQCGLRRPGRCGDRTLASGPLTPASPPECSLACRCYRLWLMVKFLRM